MSELEELIEENKQLKLKLHLLKCYFEKGMELFYKSPLPVWTQEEIDEAKKRAEKYSGIPWK